MVHLRRAVAKAAMARRRQGYGGHGRRFFKFEQSENKNIGFLTC